MPIRGDPTKVTVEEFKEWLLKRFDADRDGRISKCELREAIRDRGGWFTTLKAGRAVRHADIDHSGFVEDSEIENLVAFAQKHLGMNFSSL